jgi:hypothetical protein
MARRPLAALLGCLCLLGARPVAAQIVNVQSTLTAQASEGFSGSLDASIDWRTGNTELLVLAGALVGRYRSGKNLIVAIARGEIGFALEQRIIGKTFEHIRYRRTLTPLLTAETFLQHEIDEFRRLSLRALAGLGPKLDLVRAPGWELSWGVAYMLELERLGSVGQPDDGQETLAHRISTYVITRIPLAERLDIVETLYAQPRLDELGDIRILNDLQLVVKVTTRVAFRTSFNLSHDSRPPAGVKKFDSALKSAISVSF